MSGPSPLRAGVVAVPGWAARTRVQVQTAFASVATRLTDVDVEIAVEGGARICGWWETRSSRP